MRLALQLLSLSLLVHPLAGCATTSTDTIEPDPVTAGPTRTVGDEIIVCGERVSTGGAPVVLWNEKGGYNAYSTQNHFPDTDPFKGPRYSPGRADKLEDGSLDVKVPADSTRPEDLIGPVDLFVVHYDVCGTSKTCFKVLHDVRHLSVQFMIDLDGTIYQTMDVREKAWHAAEANRRSIGVEMANIGAYPVGSTSQLDLWYDKDPIGAHVAHHRVAGNIRTPGYIARPARPDRIRGRIHGVELEQYDFTNEQYDSLSKLVATLCRTIPSIRPDAPRDANGVVRTDSLSEKEFAEFSGILGHNHVTVRKQDPGPAFDWERFLTDVRNEIAAP